MKKIILISLGSVILFAIIIIILVSPIAKYLIERYDEKFTGRQISIGWIYVNPFTGYFHISNLKIFESENFRSYRTGDSIFISAEGLSANFALLKLWSKTIEISGIVLNRPRGIVIQNQKDFNFSDIVKTFTPDHPAKTPSAIRFNLLDMRIRDGEFHYREDVIPVKYFIKNVQIESPGKRSDADTMAVKFSLVQGVGSGDVKGDFTVNFNTGDYRFGVVVRKFDLQALEQYLKDLANYGSFSANLDADMKSSGNFSDAEAMSGSGMIAINEFHFGKNPDEDYMSFEKLVLAIKEISPKRHKYLFDSVSLMHPFVKYERYDYLDNVQAMFGKDISNITAVTSNPARFNLIVEIARYVKVLAKNFFRSDYKINRLAVYKGDVRYTDYAISEKFQVDLDPLFITADSIDKNHDRVEVLFKSGIKPYGNVKITLSINPNDSLDFDLHYSLQKMSLAMFNPYLLTYTSFPLDRGTIGLDGIWNVRNGTIRSSNHILIIDPRRTHRVRNEGRKWLPIRLIMSLVRERGNVIDYQVPITGNLKDPKFHLRDVIVDVLENIVVKPATASYRMEVKNMETEIEKFLTFTWETRHNEMETGQEKFVEKMADFLAENPGASISVYPQEYALKEREYILFFEAKKKYFLLINHKNANSFDEDDSSEVDRMSVKDSLFVHYLDKLDKGTKRYTIQEKCSSFVGTAVVEHKFNQLNSERETVFMRPFLEQSLAARVKIHEGRNVIPFNGFSFYRIEYQGKFPESVLKAHRKMNELNNKAPRKKYKKDRKRAG